MAAEPIKLHPDNPRYFLLGGRPAVLITSGEHYGAVLNRLFDYREYLRTLGRLRLNLTRTFSEAYCENPGAFKIRNNTLAPKRGQLICPWARSETPGYAGGGNKFDLTRFDEAYFKRLRGFVAQAGKEEVVVELVLFCPFYRDEMWHLSPMNAANNVNGVGKLKRTNAYTLRNGKLLDVQLAMVAEIVTALNGFDNLYYEICNEPYFGGVTPAWQARIAETIVNAERKLPRRHLIARNIANKHKRVVKPDPNVSIFNFHYAWPPKAVAMNWRLNRPIGDDETGFRGSKPTPYRTEGWDFILAGGAVYSNLDYSFTVGHEDGTAKINAPGGGGRTLQKQLRILKDFIEGFDFVKMAPDNSIIAAGVPEDATARALVQPGRAVAIYILGGREAKLAVKLPAGTWQADWLNTKTGKIDKTETFPHDGGAKELESPKYTQDIALSLKRVSK